MNVSVETHHYGALPYPTVTPQLQALLRTGRVFSLQQTMRPICRSGPCSLPIT